MTAKDFPMFETAKIISQKLRMEVRVSGDVLDLGVVRLPYLRNLSPDEMAAVAIREFRLAMSERYEGGE